MGKTKTFPWDGADGIRTEADVIAEMDVALQEEDPCVIALTLDDICRSEAMSRLAPTQRENLQGAISASSDLKLGAVLDVVRALGLRLRVESATVASPGCDTEPETAELRRSARPRRIFRRLAVDRR